MQDISRQDAPTGPDHDMTKLIPDTNGKSSAQVVGDKAGFCLNYNYMISYIPNIPKYPKPIPIPFCGQPVVDLERYMESLSNKMRSIDVLIQSITEHVKKDPQADQLHGSNQYT